MIVINQSQMETFKRAMEQRFPRELAEYLTDKHPEELRELSRSALDSRVDYAIECARKLGFRDANAIAGFAALMFVIGPAFFQQPSIELILRDVGLLPTERLAQLPAEISPGAWLEARRISEQRWPDEQGS